MKKSKKFVLAGLVLLAITMVLLPLAGCKTEVDTSSPQQEQPGETDNGNNDNDASVITTGDPAAFIAGITAAGTYTLVATNECTDTAAIKEALWALESRQPEARIHLNLSQSGITSIGNRAFQYCSSLARVEIPSSVTSIGNSAFEGCSSLDSVTFQAGSQLASIGNSAFYECISLASVKIPTSVTSIGDDAFFGCSELSTVKVEAEGPPILGTNVFDATDAGLKIHVPGTSAGYYISNWSAYADKIEPITS